MRYNTLVILGPTASGKTRLAARVAHLWHSEIISADSRQVYQGMDLGTGKDKAEYIIGTQHIPTHLIDCCPAGTSYHIAQFQNDFYQAFSAIEAKGKVPIVCGGSGMYLEAVLQNYQYTQIPVNEALRQHLQHLTDEELQALAGKLPSSYSHLADLSTRKRTIRAIEISTYLQQHAWVPPTSPSIHPLPIGLLTNVETRRSRITQRLHDRLDQGMVDEVQKLLTTVPAEKLLFYGLEYKFITQYLQGQLAYETMVTQLNTAIHQFAKRQMTYFRHMESNGLPIHWINAEQDLDTQLKEIETLWTQ